MKVNQSIIYKLDQHLGIRLNIQIHFRSLLVFPPALPPPWPAPDTPLPALFTPLPLFTTPPPLITPLPTRPRSTLTRSCPTPTPTPWLMTTPRPASAPMRHPMAPATSRAPTQLLFPMVESSVSPTPPTVMMDTLPM